ncbi:MULTISPECIES: HPr(Ser) kinase/phosphatase [unclassified Clostridioides]|uniref:HPr(Ser) kinase/phosphatase n=1 Tax=unclassified Clostridioides TaxID=2635829 RepID=UPI001D0CBB6A|nr:HPr kinase/phosphorylase [Clostridioides sp. ZZV15-6388]MCC0637666.1 HPr kinase/phosphorylase [Clostridioides sp. ES-S-0001-02]MCC0642024.1 HPr kinase/phosphorylase [Clostridioides sp. ES-S-0049-03]MCC0646232.1 HPr kinase/phosphorylase [Clostridioides sp. ZZV14-6150]MCC0650951.1 HPr kinase/phosphorylase [Clostridioides sp. ES-S-0001-03]MCC0660722.1 HPr kinase/phosphorylase [Clostridioides sp. ZZV14-6154]MCC0665163.1 HPr kinase/phosphorylase [Clostridioides sp. ZZV15-6597]MCC0669788.1 HPr 
METSNKVSIREIIKDLKLKVVYMPDDVDYYVYSQDINRPGLQFAGYFDYFAYERIQIVGKTEYNFFGLMDNEIREEVLNRFFSYEIPALIISRDLEIKPDVIEKAKKYKRILLSTNRNTTRLINRLSNYLDNKLAPHTTIHGVLVDIYGIGVLIKGESSIGKSETALELIQRGNRLVADDAVEIRKLDESMLMGQSPELIRHFLEIRGIGIIDVRSLYGVGAIKNSKMIDLVVHLEAWDENKYYDRLGLDKEYEEILGVNVEKLVVPVKPGRNTAMILEVAAMNFRQRGMGYDAAQEFTKKLSKLIDTK